MYHHAQNSQSCIWFYLGCNSLNVSVPENVRKIEKSMEELLEYFYGKKRFLLQENFGFILPLGLTSSAVNWSQLKSFKSSKAIKSHQKSTLFFWRLPYEAAILHYLRFGNVSLFWFQKYFIIFSFKNIFHVMSGI